MIPHIIIEDSILIGGNNTQYDAVKYFLYANNRMIYVTGIISLIIQIIVGVIDYLAIKIEVDSKDELLKDLLKVELWVQAVEFIFYVFLIFYFNKISRNITPLRYIDWAITTPLMLITLSAFLYHNGRTSGRLTDFLYNHKGSIIKIVFLNAAMLLFGLVGEFGYLNPYLSTALGFIPFTLNFKYIKDTFLPSSQDRFKNGLFYWFVFFWALYGVCAIMNYTNKNTGYNILDIFAKNFFGLFLAYIVWTKTK
jgi:bacteriorhodopsin